MEPWCRLLGQQGQRVRPNRPGKQMYFYVYLFFCFLFVFIFYLYIFYSILLLTIILRALPDSNRRLYFKVLVFKTSALNQTRPSTPFVNMPHMFEFEYSFVAVTFPLFLFIYLFLFILLVWLRFLFLYFYFLFFVFLLLHFCLCFLAFASLIASPVFSLGLEIRFVFFF
jgi:hypothetical protein